MNGTDEGLQLTLKCIASCANGGSPPGSSWNFCSTAGSRPSEKRWKIPKFMRKPTSIHLGKMYHRVKKGNKITSKHNDVILQLINNQLQIHCRLARQNSRGLLHTLRSDSAWLSICNALSRSFIATSCCPFSKWQNARLISCRIFQRS